MWSACEMTLGVRNYFSYPFGFPTMCEIGLGVRSFFAWSMKISQSVQIDFVGVGLFSLGVQIWFVRCAKFCTPCEMIP